MLAASALLAGVQRPLAACSAGVSATSLSCRSLSADAGSAPYFRWSSLHAQEDARRVHSWLDAQLRGWTAS